jgi:hypothetical protein
MQYFVLLVCLMTLTCSRQWSYVQSTGANTHPPYRVCIEAPNPDKFRPAIQVWNKSAEAWRPIIESCPGDVEVVESGPEACGEGDHLACANALGGHIISMIRGAYEGDPAGVLAHELGHILGAQHVEGTLMSAHYQRGQLCPDLITVTQVAAYQHAPLTQFSWCY